MIDLFLLNSVRWCSGHFPLERITMPLLLLFTDLQDCTYIMTFLRSLLSFSLQLGRTASLTIHQVRGKTTALEIVRQLRYPAKKVPFPNTKRIDPTAGPKKKITVKLDMEKLKDPFFNPLAEYFPEAHQQQKGLVYDKKPFRYTCEAGKAYKWCACGHSKSQPFCDNSHSIAGLKCNIRPVPFMAVEKKSVWFCNCKQTAHPPFCDGTHRRVEIQTLSLEAPKPLTTTEE